MSNTETWGIVLRERAGAERWIACEVTSDERGRFRAKSAAGFDGMSYGFDVAAVEAHARWIERTDATVAHARSVTREAYAAHMEGVRSALVADEVERLRADLDAARERVNRYADALFMVGRFVGVEAYESEPIIDAIRSAVRASLTAERARADQLADTIGAIGRRVCAESCERDVILDAIGEAYDAARRGGEVSMRHAAASWCERAGHADLAAEVRALQLTPQPAQRPAASETPEAPSPFADAAARARDAARGRVASEAVTVVAPVADAWVESWTDAGPRGLRVIRKTLATVAGERWYASRLCGLAGLDECRIDMSGDASTMWFGIINEAVKVGRLDALVAAAREEFPRCGL